MSSSGTRYGLYSPGSSGWSSMRNEEFQEDDVWGVFKERNEFDSGNISLFQEGAFISKNEPTAARMIPRASMNQNQNLNSHETKIVQSSAPVSVPDWSKIYGTGSKINGHDFGRSHREIDDDDEDEDDGDITPPHEWIARKLASSQTSSFSVCEGIGRTLKGRDLSRVRNAVLTKTGFLE